MYHHVSMFLITTCHHHLHHLNNGLRHCLKRALCESRFLGTTDEVIPFGWCEHTHIHICTCRHTHARARTHSRTTVSPIDTNKSQFQSNSSRTCFNAALASPACSDWFLRTSAHSDWLGRQAAATAQCTGFSVGREHQNAAREPPGEASESRSC